MERVGRQVVGGWGGSSGEILLNVLFFLRNWENYQMNIEITNSNSQGWENKKTIGLSFKCPGCFCFTRFKVPFFKEIKSKFGFRKHSTKVAPSSTKMKSPTRVTVPLFRKSGA